MPIPTKIEVTATETFTLTNEMDARSLTSFIRQQGIQVGMNVLNQTKLITAASELVRNMLLYADGGKVTVESISSANKKGIRVICIDQGPGIADVDQAMKDGYSTGNGMGLGLPGAKRLSNEFSLKTAVGQGTTVTIIKWANR